MARLILLFILLLVIARTFWRFVDAVMRAASGSTPPGSAPRQGPAAVKMSQCPVCGTYVVPGKAISIVSGGSPVYFDTEKCRAEYQSR